MCVVGTHRMLVSICRTCIQVQFDVSALQSAPHLDDLFLHRERKELESGAPAALGEGAFAGTRVQARSQVPPDGQTGAGGARALSMATPTCRRRDRRRKFRKTEFRKIPLSTEKAYAAYQAAEAHCQVARADRDEAIATVLETMAAAREAVAVAEAAIEAAEAESDQEEEVWVWHPVDDYHIREENVVPMVLAVSMHAAGYAACAACALLAVQEALRLASVDEEGEKEYHALENT